MIRNILIAFLLAGTACAMHLEYLNVESDNEQYDESWAVGQGEDIDWKKIPCEMCQYAMKKLKKHIGNKERADVIKNKLLHVCSKIPGVGKRWCESIINSHIDFLTKELSTQDDPRTICVKIRICKSNSLLEFIQAFPEVQQKL